MTGAPKAIKRQRRRPPATASGEALRRALLPLATGFERWWRGAATSSELAGLIHDFHEKPVRAGASPTVPSPSKRRRSHEPPSVVAKLGWRYHHIGIPTDVRRAGETHLEKYGLHVTGFPTSPYGIEWMRFDEDSPVHPLIKTLPHVAFEVDDLNAALEGQEVIGPPGAPSEGVRSAMIVVDGAPVELIWFRKPARRDRK